MMFEVFSRNKMYIKEIKFHMQDCIIDCDHMVSLNNLRTKYLCYAYYTGVISLSKSC